MQFQITYGPTAVVLLYRFGHARHGAREPRPQRGSVNPEVALALVVAWSALRARITAVFLV